MGSPFPIRTLRGDRVAPNAGPEPAEMKVEACSRGLDWCAWCGHGSVRPRDVESIQDFVMAALGRPCRGRYSWFADGAGHGVSRSFAAGVIWPYAASMSRPRSPCCPPAYH